ncbi:MAG TPA: sialidase family protein, partial [Paraburkholderia sp.]|nr:sialidase family protein [Paraburkholderia sp.]
IYYAVSSDGGRSFATERKIVDHTCECCQIALALDGEGRVQALWRNVFSVQIRDHALAVSMRHMAWFSVVNGRADVYYSRLDANGKPDGERWAFAATGSAGTQASHAALLASGSTLWLAWKDFDGDTMRILVRRSDDGGRHWSAPRELAQTAGGSDNPQLIDDAGRVYLSWRTQYDGYMLLPTDEEWK